MLGLQYWGKFVNVGVRIGSSVLNQHVRMPRQKGGEDGVSGIETIQKGQFVIL